MQNSLLSFFEVNNSSIGISGDTKQKYCDFIFNTPYCSAQAFFLKYKSEVSGLDPGNNCIGLSVIIKELFCVGKGKSLFLKSGRHYPLIYQNSPEECITFLDPYLLHKEPINLTEVITNENQVFYYDVYPDVEGNKMELKYCTDSNALIQKKWVGDNLIEFNYDLSAPVYNDPDPYRDDLLYHSEQDNLSIRIIEESGRSTIHLVCVLKKIVKRHQQNQELKLKLYSISNGVISMEGNENFDFDILKISQRIKATPDKVLQHFKRCVEAYLCGLPQSFDFTVQPVYNPSNV